jgi:lysine 2-monooxygenase
VGKEPKSRGTPLRKVRPHSDGEKYKRPNVDIAIIGAGVAGLYVAWRLLSEAKSYAKSIALFDSADRVGGRIYSVTVPGVPYVTDLGAMRYLPEQILVQSLIAQDDRGPTLVLRPGTPTFPGLAAHFDFFRRLRLPRRAQT